MLTYVQTGRSTTRPQRLSISEFFIDAAVHSPCVRRIGQTPYGRVVSSFQDDAGSQPYVPAFGLVIRLYPELALVDLCRF